jgi:cathepsin D
MRFDSSYSKMLRGFGDYERNTGKPHPRSLGIKDSKRPFAPIAMQYTRDMWVGRISVGTPSVQFNVNFDTGSGAFFLATIGCERCLGQNLYHPFGSSTARTLSRPFNIRYVDGTHASGQLYTDTVRIGHLIATQQTLGAVSAWTKLERSLDDGIMGLGFRSSSMYNALPVFQRLIYQHPTDLPVFTMKLVQGAAVSTFGGLNGDLYNGAITYVDITGEGWWEIKSDFLSIDGQVVFKEITCLIDSACSN